MRGQASLRWGQIQTVRPRARESGGKADAGRRGARGLHGRCALLSPSSPLVVRRALQY